MEKPSSALTVDVESQHSAAQHGGDLPAVDDVDEPPIPSAGSSCRRSVLLKDKGLDGARYSNEITTTSSFTTVEEKDGSAHTLTQHQVATTLGTDCL